ncbi:MAG: ADP-ribosylglycohydrolase family protein [Planctomycetota bacterium]
MSPLAGTFRIRREARHKPMNRYTELPGTRIQSPTRRSLMRASLGVAAWHSLSRNACAQKDAASSGDNNSSNTSENANAGLRRRGVLVGGLIGDALGGPLEFSSASAAQKGTADVRSWDLTPLTNAQLEELGNSLPMRNYKSLRPSTAPYGPWRPSAPLGTLTDDSRHKIVLLQALRHSQASGKPLSRQAIAKSFVDFRPAHDAPGISAERLDALNEEGFREYRYASRWLLGERDLSRAKPVGRLWAGVNNCSGQMMFPPLAAAFAGDPEAAYRATYQLDFIDTSFARDMTAALNAGLAAALSKDLDSSNHRERWDVFFEAMRDTDPFELRKVPFAGRQLDRWLDRCEQWLTEAAGVPAKLFEILETKAEPKFWWDAHFTLIVPICILRLCKYHPLAAMHLTLDFGHDSDSYAQVLGCMIGAIHGESIFPAPIRVAVTKTLRTDYNESIDEWLTCLDNVTIEEF